MQKKITTLKNIYGKYVVQPKEYGIKETCKVYKTLKAGRVWEQNTISYITENANNKAIVHAGVYIGDMLPVFSKCTYGTLYAFEANPMLDKSIKMTIAINNLCNVEYHNVALGEKEKKNETFIYAYKTGEAIGGGARIDKKKWLSEYESPKTIEKYVDKLNKRMCVDMKPIDSFVNEEVSIIHLDIEDYEIEALKGAMKTIKKYKPILILESVTGFEKFFRKNILPLGYKEERKLDANRVWRG